MSKELPEKVKTYFITNEGYDYDRRDNDILNELVIKFNELLDYLREQV